MTPGHQRWQSSQGMQHPEQCWKYVFEISRDFLLPCQVGGPMSTSSKHLHSAPWPMARHIPIPRVSSIGKRRHKLFNFIKKGRISSKGRSKGLALSDSFLCREPLGGSDWDKWSSPESGLPVLCSTVKKKKKTSHS